MLGLVFGDFRRLCVFWLYFSTKSIYYSHISWNLVILLNLAGFIPKSPRNRSEHVLGLLFGDFRGFLLFDWISLPNHYIIWTINQILCNSTKPGWVYPEIARKPIRTRPEIAPNAAQYLPEIRSTSLFDGFWMFLLNPGMFLSVFECFC